MIDLLKGENSGVIVGVRATDFMAGAESGVAYKELVSDGDWTKYKPTDEWQRRYIPPSTLGYDTNSCTDFSALNSVEAQIERMLQKGELPKETIDRMKALGYFDSKGMVNFSDWYNAITAGTTNERGNTLYATWDAIRKDGLIPQSEGSQVNDFTAASGWFNTKPTAAQYALGKQFLEMFDVRYEWIVIGQLGQTDAMKHHLKQAPLHLLVPTRSTWNNAIVENVGAYTGVNHAVSLFAQEQGSSHTVLDHYNPFEKKLAWNYYMPFVLKGVVTPKITVNPEQPFHYVYQSNLAYGMGATTEVKMLQKGLQALGYMTKGLFGVYGAQTAAGVAMVQKLAGITDPSGPGRNFGPKTRAAMNAALEALV